MFLLELKLISFCRCCQAHELNTDLLINAIESLGNLVKTKEIAIRVTEKHAMEQVLQVIKSQDFSIVNLSSAQHLNLHLRV